MATLLSALETQARRHLIETTATFWSSAELIDIMNNGFKDLWGAILDVYGEHYQTLDITNVSISASTATMSGIPTDVFRINQIAPKVVSSTGTYRNLKFIPRDLNSPDFQAAQTLGDVDPGSGQIICYAISGAGAPVGAPIIHIAPTLNSAIAAGNIRFVYNPTIAVKAAANDNPIPGESDQAIINWTVGWARAKEREDRSPDPNWIAAYANEKNNIITRITPRQTHEPEYIEPMFEGYW